MNADTQLRNYGFALGIMAGTIVGAGLMMWLAPGVAGEVRKRVTDSAKGLANRTSEQYRQVGDRVGTAIDDLTRKGQSVRDDMADVVVHGAQAVERFATVAKTSAGAREL